MIDTHCHLQFNAYKNDAEQVIGRCREKKMLMNVVGTQRDTSLAAVEFAEKYPNIYATIGLHPIHTTSTEVDEEEVSFKSREERLDYKFYKKLASNPKVIAIGECGIELFHLPADADREAIVAKHRESFLMQAKLAQEFDLPMVIHVRDAYEEMIDTLKLQITNYKLQIPAGVIHCYTGNWTQAQKFLDLGLYLGFTAARITRLPALLSGWEGLLVLQQEWKE